MLEKRFDTPIGLIIFNRPEKTARVLERLRALKPLHLLIVADGPRTEQERSRCEATRAVIDTIDWDCTIRKNYSEVNLGCRRRVSSGISWIFEQVDQAIILEDDCLPEPSFFPYCAELLERYKDDARVMHISGDNFQQSNPRFSIPESYYFSRVPHVWGWASWRRAWKLYDVDLSEWPTVKENQLLKKSLPEEAARLHWEHVFQQYYDKKIDSWDGQWVYCCLMHGGLSANPCVNLIENIGFDADATHSIDNADMFACLPTEPLVFPLVHPAETSVQRQADVYTMKYIFGIDRTLQQKMLSFFRSRFPDLYRFFRSVFSYVRSRTN